MKLKDAKIKGWPKKRRFSINCEYGSVGYIENIKTEGFEQTLDLIGNLEFNPADYVELDVEKMTKIFQEQLEHSRLLSWVDIKKAMEAIANKTKEVVK